jgi:hypothetical protein
MFSTLASSSELSRRVVTTMIGARRHLGVIVTIVDLNARSKPGVFL